MMNLNTYYHQHKDMFERYFSALDKVLPAEVYLDYENDDGGNFGDVEGELYSNYGLSADVAQGATRLVIIPNELDVVIKIGAVGAVFYDYSDEDSDEATESYETWNGCYNSNYCESEVDAYGEVEWNYSAALPFFLPVKTFWHNDRIYYVQQKIDITYSNAECADDVDFKIYKLRKPSDKSRKVIEHKMSNSRYEDIRLAFNWLARGYEMYGADALNALLSYLVKTESGEAANADFHYSNFGYVEGRPVIFDYAGFHEDF